MSLPDEAESTPESPTTASKEAGEGPDTRCIASRLRLQPSPAMTLQLLKDAICGYSPVSVLSQLTIKFLFVRRDEFHEES